MGSEMGFNLQKGNADPLGAKLCDTQQAGQTLCRFDLAATGNVLPGRRHGEDVREAGRGRGSPQQDEPGRYAFGCAAGDDTIMLREVRYQQAEKDQTAPRGNIVSKERRSKKE